MTKEAFLKACEISEVIGTKQFELNELDKTIKIVVCFRSKDGGRIVTKDYAIDPDFNPKFNQILQLFKDSLQADIAKLNQEFEAL